MAQVRLETWRAGGGKTAKRAHGTCRETAGGAGGRSDPQVNGWV